MRVIARNLVGLVFSPMLLPDLVTTLYELIMALVIAISLGLSFGLIVGTRKYLRDTFNPILIVLYGIPKIIVLPIFLMLFKVGANTQIAFGIVYAFFPITLNVISGVRSVNRTYLRVLQSIGASPIQVFAKVLVPSIVYPLFAGAKQGVTLAMLGVITGELIASIAGLGHSVWSNFIALKIPGMYSYIVIIILISFILNELTRRIELRLAVWKIPSSGS